MCVYCRGMLSLTNFGNMFAYEKTTNVVGEFLRNFHKTMGARTCILNFIKGIKHIQKRWKGMIKLDKTRRKLLRGKWDQMLESLIKQHHIKGKKMPLIVRKLRAIPDVVATKTLNVYYEAQKKKYYAILAKWFAKKKVIEVHILLTHIYISHMCI